VTVLSDGTSVATLSRKDLSETALLAAMAHQEVHQEAHQEE
jgi:ribose transport system ATP-binding protein